MGAIISYIVAFVIYFSFTTVGRRGYVLLSLVQPVATIILYSLFTGQFDSDFFIRAIIFFVACAFIFAIPYRRGLFHVSKVYKEATGMSGYSFIRAFILSMMSDGNDDLIESYFDRVGIKSSVNLQYVFIRKVLYKAFSKIPGTTVYHTTNDHALNLTTQGYVEVILEKIKRDFQAVINDNELEWLKEIKDFTRKISNSAKLIGTEIGKVPLMLITRHPLPSDDIEAEVGDQIRDVALSNGYEDPIIIDSHNAIIGDEILIKKGTLEAEDLINVTKNYLNSKKVQDSPKVRMLYGVAKGTFERHSEKEGIGLGGVVLHLFKNSVTDQMTALIHFDANNAYVEIRSNILNLLQNRGIERGEITTSDSHTVARQFSARGYSPIGDKIQLDEILEKIDWLIREAEENLEPVEFFYKNSREDNVKIWGNHKYFNVILDTLKECIKVSQSLLTLSLIIPTFFSLILLLFLYNI
jgi:predicted neutral ceramidase superfamily lipid hydrolase